MTTRTGLLPFWKNYDRKLYLKAAILADELGYDSFWIPEAWGYEVFSLLTEIAVHTKQIKLGTGIVNCFSRSPGLLAMNAATVDEISEETGRSRRTVERSLPCAPGFATTKCRDRLVAGSPVSRATASRPVPCRRCRGRRGPCC